MSSRNISGFLLLLMALILSSCAIETKPPQEETEAPLPEKIQVSEEVQQQFDQSLALLSEGKYTQAIEILETLLKQEPRFVAPYVNLGMAYARMDKRKQAEKYLRMAVEIDLGHGQANNELGILYRKMGRFADARKAYENALAEHPDYLPVLRNFGILCDLYLGDLDCALQLYEKYLDLEEDKTVKIWLTDLKRRM